MRGLQRSQATRAREADRIELVRNTVPDVQAIGPVCGQPRRLHRFRAVGRVARAGRRLVLWSVDTKRETMRLLVLQGAKLLPSGRASLEAAILAGPPRHMYRAELEPDDWQSLVDDAIWLHLAKLRESGGQLGTMPLDASTPSSGRVPTAIG